MVSILVLSILFVLRFTSAFEYRENIYHEQVHKALSEQFQPTPVFLTNDPQNHLYATPKHCLRQEQPGKRSRPSKTKTTTTNADEEGEGGGSGSSSKPKKEAFVSSWNDFLNDFYWDDGHEYSKWTREVEDVKDSEKEPWYMLISVIIPLLFYVLSMCITGLSAPFISYLMFHFCYLIYRTVVGKFTRRILRKLWIKNERRKRRQVLMIYEWAKKLPKIRAQLPWILREHPDEELPPELRDLIPESSSEESSIGEDNADYYYEGMEEDHKEAIKAQKAKLERVNEINKKRKSVFTGAKGGKKVKRIVPWKANKPSNVHTTSAHSGHTTHTQAHQKVKFD